MSTEKRVEVVLKYPYPISGDVGSIAILFGRQFTISEDPLTKDSKGKLKKIYTAKFNLETFQIEASRVVTRKKYDEAVKKDSFDAADDSADGSDAKLEKARSEFSDGLDDFSEKTTGLNENPSRSELESLPKVKLIEYAKGILSNEDFEEVSNNTTKKEMIDILVQMDPRE